MRTIALMAASCLLLVGTTAASAQTLVSTNVVSSAETYVCPKCGKVHTRQSAVTPPVGISSSSSIQPVSYEVPSAPTSAIRAVGGIRNVLANLNAQRARQGIAGLRYDPSLQAVAERRAQQMAASGLKNHPPGSFSPGRYEGVGWSSSYTPSGVSACFTSDTRMQYAGAAMATGRDGVYFAVVYR